MLLMNSVVVDWEGLDGSIVCDSWFTQGKGPVSGEDGFMVVAEVVLVCVLLDLQY